jgi:RNA polymerase sigma-70 factor (ECF subfamily)
MRNAERVSAETGLSGRLLEQIAEGSAQAFDRLYELTSPMVRALAEQLLGDPMEAEDVCHDVFLQVICHPERYDPARGSVEAWLAVLARSRALDRLRRRKRVFLADREELAKRELSSARTVEAGPENRVMAKLETEAVRMALLDIPGAQRRLLAEAYFHGRSQRELAEAWRVPLGTVKSRVRYGLGHLRRALARMGWVEPEGGERRG